jgi:hypothetical protein
MGRSQTKTKQTSDDDDNHNQRYHNGLANKLENAGHVVAHTTAAADAGPGIVLVMDARGRVELLTVELFGR